MDALLWRVVLLQVLALTALTSAAAQGFDETAYPESQRLDPNYNLFWKVNETANRVRFGLKAKTSGFVALGFSEVGAMVGSDAAIGWVDGGRAVVLDYFIFNKSISTTASPEGVLPDGQQDITTISGEQYKDSAGDTWTALEFERPLVSTDVNDRSIVEGANQIIWSMGSTTTLGYHGAQRGGVQLTFYGGEKDPIIPPGSETLNLTLSRYQVPVNYTTYACTFFNITLPAKRHSAGWEVIVDSNSPQAVHHLVAFQCSDQELVDSPQLFNYSNTECSAGVGCSQVFSVWAVGGKAVVLPTDVGLPLGPGGATHLMLQMHYTNPDGRSDIWDQTRISYSLAPQLRPIEAGIFVAGPYAYEDLISIPPGKPSWSMQSTCTSSCIDGFFQGNVTLFASMLHMHTIGAQIWTDLIRGNQSTSIGRADYYDFNFQQYKKLPQPVTLQAGDELVTTCVWDSTGRSMTTPGGPSTQEEMCMNFILYWPRKEVISGGCFDGCVSSAQRFQPAFSGEGQVFEICSSNDNGQALLNQTCTYPLRGGQNVIQKKLNGDPTRSMASLPSSELTNRGVPATLASIAPPPATLNGATPPPAPNSAGSLSHLQGASLSTTHLWTSLAVLGFLLQALT